MPFVNVDRILNESPAKRLVIGWNHLKQNFTESEAASYLNIYKDQPLSFILENSNMIFTEPYFGRSFYKEVFEHAREYPYVFANSEETEKVKWYIETYEGKMSDTQINEYKELLSFMEETLSSVKGLLFEETAGAEVEKSRIIALSDALYKNDMDTIVKEFSEVESASTFFSFLVPVYESTMDASFVLTNAKRFISENIMESESLTEENFEKFVQNSLVVGKLMSDATFVESVNALPRPVRILFTGYNEENIMEHAVELRNIHVSEIPVSPVFESSQAVNSIFQDIVMEFTAEDHRETRKHNDALMGMLYGVLFNQVYQEYTQADDTSAKITGYPFFENTTIDEAMQYVTEKSIQYNTGKPSKVVAQHTTTAREEDPASKKSNAPSISSNNSVAEPEKKDLATRIQNKAMDYEAKQMKKMAERDEKGQKIKGAVKAVLNVPENIMDKLKQSIHEWDVADDDRRKQYIIEPGFRKKAFRNLKLAILYGATASVNVLLLPITMMVRHFSKEKDKRIRVELFRELDTEIKICEEKIADANANGDQKQKYELMRLKSKLEAESLRVKTNSKYV